MQSSSTRYGDIELVLGHIHAVDGGLMPEVKRAIDGRNERFFDFLRNLIHSLIHLRYVYSLSLSHDLTFHIMQSHVSLKFEDSMFHRFDSFLHSITHSLSLTHSLTHSGGAPAANM
jgi:hypothetical protein